MKAEIQQPTNELTGKKVLFRFLGLKLMPVFRLFVGSA